MSIVDSAMRDKVLEADYRERSKVVMKQETDKAMLHAFIVSKLSLESEDELKRHTNYSTLHASKDPLDLWKALQQLHLTNTISKNAAFVLQQSENDYMTCHQGEFESITKFKERFDLMLKAYDASLDPANQVSDKQAAMAFLTKLHRTPYGQFYANEINLINSDPTKVPNNVNEVYVKAKAYVIIATTNKQNGTPVSFATTAESFLRSNKKKGPRGTHNTNNPNNGLYVSKSSSTSTTTPQVEAAVDPHDQATVPASNLTTNSQPKDLSRVQCYNCQAFGHFARECPSKNDTLNGMTMDGDSYYQPKWYEVGLDSMSQVNVMNSRFLVDFIPAELSFKGLSSQTRKTSYSGSLPLLPGLVCQVCDDCAASVLSMAQIKKTGVKVSYDGNKDCFTIHTPKGDINFIQKGDLYLADFSQYVTDRALIAMLTKQREEMFEKSIAERAQEAGQFIRNAGYLSEQAAINLVRSGNIINIPVQVQDIKNYFEIYGVPIAAIRGRTTQDSDITVREDYDFGLKEQVTVQEIVADIMHVAGDKFMVSLSSPLQIVLMVPTPLLSKLALGRALQQHIDLLRMFGHK